MPKTGQRNLELTADFAEGHIGHTVFRCQCTEGELPYSFVEFLTVPLVVRNIHGDYPSRITSTLGTGFPGKILQLSSRCLQLEYWQVGIADIYVPKQRAGL